MHIPDGWVDLPTSAGGGAVALAATAFSARRAARSLKERVTTLPAVVAAYVLVAQLLVIPIGYGSSAHLIGTGLAALLVGPEVTIVCVAVVVVVQALVLADGGVTAIGLNTINDGILPALVAWWLFKLLRPLARHDKARAVLGGVAAGAGSLAAAGGVAVAFALGGTRVVPVQSVAETIGGAHLLVAAGEAVLTALALGTILRLRPDLVVATRSSRSEPATGTDHLAVAEPATPPAEPVEIEARADDADEEREAS